MLVLSQSSVKESEIGESENKVETLSLVEITSPYCILPDHNFSLSGSNSIDLDVPVGSSEPWVYDPSSIKKLLTSNPYTKDCVSFA